MRPDLPKRVYGAILAVLPAALLIGLGGWWLLAVMPFLIWGLAREWTHLTLPQADVRDHLVHAAAPVVALVPFAWAWWGGREFDLAMFAICIALVLLLDVVISRVSGISRARMPFLVLGTVYITLPVLAFLWLRDGDGGLGRVIWLVLVVIATDSFAYFAGSSIGGAKLAPKISPGKTWSGLLGGCAGAAFVGAVLASFVGFHALPAAMLGVFIALVSQAGDLFESWLKRRAGVKDSGNLIPGHGGLLDRLDGYMFALPVMALIVASGGVS
ncbi:MAG: phosphatidate cytidylyltransferase [Geminicoccaceae bacterium]